MLVSVIDGNKFLPGELKLGFNLQTRPKQTCNSLSFWNHWAILSEFSGSRGQTTTFTEIASNPSRDGINFRNEKLCELVKEPCLLEATMGNKVVC